MALEIQQRKKSMPLAKFEFNLFKKLIQLEQIIGLENKQILLNLQISGGKDSMSLLYALSTVLFSKVCKLKNTYTVIVQHFNHKQRGQESDEDASFVAKECLKLGLPVFLSALPQIEIKNNFQDHFRNWRKKEAQDLSKHFAKELNCERYFIVTAHHARDHVETILLNILRGSGIEGLKGISFFDKENIYFRPFCSLSYQEINEYVNQYKIQFREDSSNLEDKYKRNYIRQHILPHFEYLQKDYENSFVKLSRSIQLEKNDTPHKTDDEPFLITQSTSLSDIFYYFKSKLNMKNISENCMKNVLHEAQLLLQKKEDKIVKEIALKSGQGVRLEKNADGISLLCVRTS